MTNYKLPLSSSFSLPFPSFRIIFFPSTTSKVTVQLAAAAAAAADARLASLSHHFRPFIFLSFFLFCFIFILHTYHLLLLCLPPLLSAAASSRSAFHCDHPSPSTTSSSLLPLFTFISPSVAAPSKRPPPSRHHCRTKQPIFNNQWPPLAGHEQDERQPSRRPRLVPRLVTSLRQRRVLATALPPP